MRIGVQLPEVEYRVSWPELWAMARLVEDGGLDSVWVGEHLLYDEAEGRRGPWEAWTTLAALAAVTERVQLGPLVAATGFHNPAMLAKQAATLDEISGGRFILGLGAGWNRTEFEAFGFAFDHRVSRFEEAFTIIRALLAGETIDFHGSYYDLPNCTVDPLGPTRGGPPLMVGSTGPRMLEATLPHVAMWNGWYQDYRNDPGEVPILLARIDQACEQVGRDPATLDKTLAILFQFGDQPARRVSSNAIADRAAMVEALAALTEAGVAHVQLVLDPIDLSSIESAIEVVREYRAV